MAVDSSAAHGPSRNLSTLDIYRRIGVDMLGLAPSSLWVDVDDYYRHNGDPWLTTTAGTGDETTVGSEAGGVFRINSGGNGTKMHSAGGSVTNTKTKKFYIAVRMQITVTPDASSNAVFGIRDLAGGDTVCVGGLGSLSTTHFVIQYDGALTGTSANVVAVDTSYHIYEFWNDDRATYKYRVDGGAVASATPVAGVTGSPTLFRRSSDNAVDHPLFLDWHVCLGERA